MTALSPEPENPRKAFAQLARDFAPAVNRLCRAYEADAEKRRDLAQDIFAELWRSLRVFDGRCSMRTWVYRVAHNVAASHVTSAKRVGVIAEVADTSVAIKEDALDDKRLLAQIDTLLLRADPIDRQVFLLHLEGLSQTETAEITGLSVTHISTKIHRLRTLLLERTKP